MYDIDAATLSEADRYKLLSATIVPRPVAWVTTQNPAGGINLAPFSFFSGVGGGLLSLAIGRLGDALKDTPANLLRTHEAVVHLVSQSEAGAMNQSAAGLDPTISEADLLHLPLIASDKLTTPGLADSRARLECRLQQHIPITAPTGGRYDMLILEVVAFHYAQTVLSPDSLHIDFDQLDPLARLSGNHYAGLGTTFTLQRPQDPRR
ncbi:flavin reductase family protein [Lacticaseibacillus sp. GG6-2]